VLAHTSRGDIKRDVESTIADFAFIESRWHTELGGDPFEEVWSHSTGDGMMGLFRWITDAKARMWEFLSIREEGTDIV
jgi:hypothetical protein